MSTRAFPVSVRPVVLGSLVAAALIPVAVLAALDLSGWIRHPLGTTVITGDGRPSALGPIQPPAGSGLGRPAMLPLGSASPVPDPSFDVRSTNRAVPPFPDRTDTALGGAVAWSAPTGSTAGGQSRTGFGTEVPTPAPTTGTALGGITHELAPAPTGTAQIDTRSELLRLINADRATVGCSALTVDARLALAAQRHAVDMVTRGYFDHVSPDGVTQDQRVAAAGYPGQVAENLAAGYSSPADVIAGWMASPGHRGNVLNCAFTAVGIGWSADSAGPAWRDGTWVADFGTL